MDNQTFIHSLTKCFNQREAVINNIVNDNGFLENIELICHKIIGCFEAGKKLIFCGNGGSSSDCQHIASEFVVKLSKDRKALPAIAITSDNCIITAIANDISYNYIFTRQLEAIAYPNDILVGFSTSGESQNVIDAIGYANKNEIITISVTGNRSNSLMKTANYKIIIPSQDTQIIQEVYLMVFHIICENAYNFIAVD